MTGYRLTKIAAALALAAGFGGYGLQTNAAPTCPETLDPAADYICFFMDVGTSFSPTDTNSLTSSFYELGYTGTLATSIYAAPATTGSLIIDSNITKVLNYYGLTGGPTNYTTIGGAQVSLKDAPDLGQSNIDNLNGPTAGRDTERFDATNDLVGLGWGLTYNYYFTGELTATGPEFTGGYIDFIFQNWMDGTSEQVLRVDITGSQLDQANLSLFGVVTYDWTGGGTDIYGLASIGDGVSDCTSVLCQNFFNMQTLADSFFDLTEGGLVSIAMVLDTNVNPPIPTPNQLVAFVGEDGDTYLIRQATLDGSVRFAARVPEPGSLALLGLGLAALGGAMRRRKVA